MADKKTQDVNDIDIRVAVIETKIENITDYLGEHKDSFKQLSSTVNDIKERLDKQNGTLPHLVDAIGDLTKEFSTITSKIYAHESKLEANNVYTKIVWGVIMLVATSGAGVLADWIINHK